MIVYLSNALNDSLSFRPGAADTLADATSAAAPLSKPMRRQKDVQRAILGPAVDVLVLDDVAGNRADAALPCLRVVVVPIARAATSMTDAASCADTRSEKVASAVIGRMGCSVASRRGFPLG
ncbi:MAG TPA: hypothetical protein VNI78_04410 [Vicinamibacterales bacterium]|nr:hypothetical protein [Vicinamibacterales bacterium]